MAGRGAGLGPAAVAGPQPRWDGTPGSAAGEAGPWGRCKGHGLVPRWDGTPGSATGEAGPWGRCRGHRLFSVAAAGASLPAACHGAGTAHATHGCQRSVTHAWLPPIRSLVLLFVVGSRLSSSLYMSLSPKVNHCQLPSPVRFPPSSESRAVAAVRDGGERSHPRWRGNGGQQLGGHPLCRELQAVSKPPVPKAQGKRRDSRVGSKLAAGKRLRAQGQAWAAQSSFHWAAAAKGSGF